MEQRDPRRDCPIFGQTVGDALIHVIPWSRYPLDLGHNFVLAHDSCNARKSNLLAAEEHLER